MGKRIGYAWACDLCCSAPRYIEEPFCNCSAAIDQFLVDYPETASRSMPRAGEGEMEGTEEEESRRGNGTNH